MAKTRYLSDKEVAAIVGCHPDTVRKWRARDLIAWRKIGGLALVYYPFRAPDGSFFKRPERQREK